MSCSKHVKRKNIYTNTVYEYKKREDVKSDDAVYAFGVN